MAKTPLREMSRGSYTGEPTLEAINSGSLQRIADATELMAKNYTSMQADLDWYKNAYLQKNQYIDELLNERRALKGVITKLKKKLAAKDQGVTV